MGSSKFGGRKFVATIIGIASTMGVGTLLVWFGKIDGAQWISLAQFSVPMLLGVYTTGNAIEKFSPGAK